MRLEHLLSREDLFPFIREGDVRFLLSLYYNITQSSTGDGVRHPGAGNYF